MNQGFAIYLMKYRQFITVLLCCGSIILSANPSDSDIFSNFAPKSFLPRSEIERNAILLGEDFVSKILAKENFSRKEEQKLFGPYGGVLGESLYVSLGIVPAGNNNDGDSFANSSTKPSPLGVLLIKKLNPIFADKERFTYCLGRNIYTYDRKGIRRAGTSAETFLLLRGILESSSAFHDKAKGITMILALRYLSDKKDRFCIELSDSYLGHIPLYQFLGFRGNFTSDLKLPDAELAQLKEYLKDTK